MNLLQELLGKGLCRARCVPKTFRGSETALKQRWFCCIPKPWSYGHTIVAYAGSAQLLCSCTALRSLASVFGQIFLDSVGEMTVSSLTMQYWYIYKEITSSSSVMFRFHTGNMLIC